jgi:threonyl-tRNA synthetase
VCVLPVGRDHVEKARAIAAQIPYRVELDESDETVGKRIRNAELEKVPFTLVVGERESEESLAIRERGGEQSQKSLSAFVSDLASL